MTYLDQKAYISDDGLYRYWLRRKLREGPRILAVIGLNPSTADDLVDDPTIRKVVGFANIWGFDDVWMGNLHAYRSTNPKRLSQVDDPVGPENREVLMDMVGWSEVVVAAWGANRLSCYAHALGEWILSLRHTRTLGRNQDGSPRHPLYLPYTTKLQG